MINEVMLSPSSGDGSIYGDNRNGEWIELYNPDICQPVDISCFFLGNNAPDLVNNQTSNFGGGFVIPQGTIVPPRGFVLLRGVAASAVPSNLLVQNGGKTIEIVVGGSLSSNVCIGGGLRLWFPNAGGWFAFYDNFGVPQDAISWCSLQNSCTSCIPCNPGVTACGYSGSLASYDNIPANKKNFITSNNPQNTLGQSYRRIPDGGNWVSTPAIPTYGTCNAACIPPPVITCNGMAVVFASGGTPPYNYKWTDQQATLNDTVTGLCAGSYTVTVKSANNLTATKTVLINNIDLKPTITVNGVSCKNGNNGSISVNMTNGASPFKFLWSNGDSTSSLTKLSPGNYLLSITDTADCHLDTNAIVPNSIVVPTITVNNPTICSGSKVTLLTTPSLAGGTYKWMPGGQQTANLIVSPLVNSTYSVIYNIFGCVASDTAIVTVNQTPSAVIHTSSTVIFIEDSVVLTSFGGLSYLWNTGNTANNMIMYPTHDTIYCVVVSNNNNCFDSTCVNIKVKGASTLYVPNAFTPNGDGLNDLFLVPYTHVEKFHMTIFNKWGNLLFETYDITVGWDGRYMGELVPDDVYVYSIEAIGEDKVNYRKLGRITVLK
ncbi:MAG: gliding motility-associated C-terminal domain-containing protein [Bacteroidetes bacterium]|nr:gliding motility-associated C-terminal domain-containing protein [Bacteroidota bacterium]